MFERFFESVMSALGQASALDAFTLVVTLTLLAAVMQGTLQSLRRIEIGAERLVLARRTIKKDLDSLARETAQVSADGVITPAEQERLKKRLEAVSKRVKDLRAENLELRRDQRSHRSLFGALDDSRARLALEGQRLGRDSWINLIIGIAFAVFGIWILSRDVLAAGQAGGLPVAGALSSHDLARLSLGLFVSVVAFFFFRMYLTNQNDIRHNKNELTTIEMRTAAVRIAIKRDDDELVRLLLGTLMATERNRILKRGERVISESLVHDKNEISDLFSRWTGGRTPESQPVE